MTAPVVDGALGTDGLGNLGLGGPQPLQSYALPAMSQTALSYIAHLYDHSLVFKRTLGGTAIIGKPGLKMTQNAGYQAITLSFSVPVPGIAIGDVIRLSEQGDSVGTILFSGNVETTPEEVGIGAGATHHQVVVTPWVAELADAYFNKTYAAATDVAQFVRDAVAATAHCSVSPISCPDSGVKAIYDFQSTTGLDAVHVAKQIAGANWWWFVDAQGVVWFQPVVTANPATITLRRGADFNRKKISKSIVGMKNQIHVIGGVATSIFDSRITADYTGVVSQALYGVKSWNPTPVFPSIADQATLNVLAQSLGAQFDRVLTTVELDCPALGYRLSPARAGGLTVRFWEPAVESLQETGATGSGGYSSTYVVQDVTVDGPKQMLICGDIPFTDTDTAYEATRIAQRISASGAVSIPVPALTPQQTPPTMSIFGFVNATTGVFTMGGGIVTIATATFTTTKTGTCQVIAAVDMAAVAWDDYVAVPRRAARLTLSGGIYTGAWVETPFGGGRATYSLSSASGLALVAGTYTVKIEINTVEYNQLRIFSGYAQVAVVA